MVSICKKNNKYNHFVFLHWLCFNMCVIFSKTSLSPFLIINIFYASPSSWIINSLVLVCIDIFSLLSELIFIFSVKIYFWLYKTSIIYIIWVKIVSCEIWIMEISIIMLKIIVWRWRTSKNNTYLSSMFIYFQTNNYIYTIKIYIMYKLVFIVWHFLMSLKYFYILHVVILTLMDTTKPSKLIIGRFTYYTFPCTYIKYKLIIDSPWYFLPLWIGVVFSCILALKIIHIYILCNGHHFMVILWSYTINWIFEEQISNLIYNSFGWFTIKWWPLQII